MTAIEELLWEILSLKNSDVTSDVTSVEGVCEKEEEREYTEVGVLHMFFSFKTLVEINIREYADYRKYKQFSLTSLIARTLRKVEIKNC